eukprot:gene10309-2453_t
MSLLRTREAQQILANSFDESSAESLVEDLSTQLFT